MYRMKVGAFVKDSNTFKRLRRKHIQVDFITGTAWLELPCCSNCIPTKCQFLWRQCQVLVSCGCLNGIQGGSMLHSEMCLHRQNPSY